MSKYKIGSQAKGKAFVALKLISPDFACVLLEFCFNSMLKVSLSVKPSAPTIKGICDLILILSRLFAKISSFPPETFPQGFNCN